MRVGVDPARVDGYEAFLRRPEGDPNHEGTQVRAAALLVVIATPVTAFAGGRHNNASTAGCSYSNGVVQGSGLPTDQVINFMVTTSSGTSDWVLGFTPDGTWSVNVAPATGSTTYQFVSRTWGPDGSRYNVFATCSA